MSDETTNKRPGGCEDGGGERISINEGLRKGTFAPKKPPASSQPAKLNIDLSKYEPQEGTSTGGGDGT